MIILQQSRGVLSSGLDSNAKAYIDKITQNGATVSSTQRQAINRFVKAEQNDFRWNSAKRIYLPIWGVAAANAVCLRSLTSGTFVGGVTHGTGFVQGNGSTGYFLTDTTCSAIGVSATGTCGVLARSDLAVATSFYGAGTAGFVAIIYSRGGVAVRAAAWGAGSGTGLTHSSSDAGIVSNTRESTTSTYARVRKTSGASLLGSGTATSTVQNLAYPQTFMASRYDTTPTNYSSVQMGAFFMSTMTTSSNVDAFSFNLKTLWESCTGLTLP